MIDEVIQNVREQFLDEGYDDQFLQELKHVIEKLIIQKKKEEYI